MLPSNFDPRRAILLMWGWNQGRDPLTGEKQYDYWPADHESTLIRMDKKAKEKDLSDSIADAIRNFKEVIILLHETHGYLPVHEHEMAQQWKANHDLLRIGRFGGAKGPLYVKNHDLGILGANNNFASKYIRYLPDGGQEDAISVCIVGRTPPQLNIQHFNHIWNIYRYAPRQSAETLMHRYESYVSKVYSAQRPLSAHLEEKEDLYNELLHLAGKDIFGKGHTPLADELLCYEDILKKSTSENSQDSDASDRKRRENILILLENLRTATRSVLESKALYHQRDPVSHALEQLFNALPPYGL